MPVVPSRPLGPVPTAATAVLDGTVWRLAGDLDAAALGLLGERLERAAAARAPGDLVVDVSGVSFCDASGLRLLCRAALAAPGPVVVVGAPDRLRDLVALCAATFPFGVQDGAGPPDADAAEGRVAEEGGNAPTGPVRAGGGPG